MAFIRELIRGSGKKRGVPDTATRRRCGGLWRGVPSVSGELHKLWKFIGFRGKSETLVSEDEFIAARQERFSLPLTLTAAFPYYET